MLQNNFSEVDFTEVRRQYNLNIINLANIQTNFIMSLPSKLNKLSEFTDKLSNLSIISGNCFLSKPAIEFKEIVSDRIIFNKDFNTFKLKPKLSYSIEPVEYKNRLSTNQKIRIYNTSKSELKSLDDLLVRKEPINIFTTENRYEYTLSLNFNDLKTFNNIFIKLNEETLSYPMVSKLYYINANQEQIKLKILNTNSYNIDLDLYRNSNNIYELDIDTITTDNIHLVLTDNIESLILDDISINFTDYSEEGSIVLEALKESKPILKIGIEGTTDENVDFQVSYDRDNWYSIDLSNTYGIEKVNKVLSFNTITPDTIRSSTDVKTLYLRLILKTIKTSYTAQNNLNREVYRTSTFNVSNLPFTSYSLYENTDSIYYGKTSNVNNFNYLDLYNQGEYLISDNKYYIKGFIETSISKTPRSDYSYSPISLKSKPIRKNGKIIKFNDIDISNKEVYSFKIETLSKNLLEITDTEYVLPLQDNLRKELYYISQSDIMIPIDLSLGYINSTLDILFAVKPEVPVYLLDSFKNYIVELNVFKIDVLGEEVSLVSLIDSGMFKNIDNLSKVYPLQPLGQYQLGLLDNKLESNNKDTKITFYELIKIPMYVDNYISNDNSNYSKIISIKDYETSCKAYTETLVPSKNLYNLRQGSVVRGSLKLSDKTLLEIPFSNGYNEFLEYYTKTSTVVIPSGQTGTEYRLELPEEDINKDSLSYVLPYKGEASYNISIQEEGDKYILVIQSKTETPTFPNSILINYTYKNLNPKSLYSIDYDKGIIHFSEQLANTLVLEYQYDNILCIGKSATQLMNKDFNNVSNNINIKTFEENSFIYFIYRNNTTEHRQLTPIVKDLKINYILKDEVSL